MTVRPIRHLPSMALRFLLPCLLAMVLAPASATADEWRLYSELLGRHTRETDDLAQTRVDYEALRKDEAWSELIAQVAATDPGALGSRDARLAYWINLYNLFAIDVVVRGRPEESIRDLGGRLFNRVWDQPAGRVGGRSYSLGEIEHEILRPLGDPRIHGAIVCASHSCPPLAREPYRAETLDDQLTANLRRWLGHPGKGLRVDRKARTLHLSSIFDWFGDDFRTQGGVRAFVARYAPSAEASWLATAGREARIRYLDYDWSLNRL
ncbi:MAG: DUF547 domain-containing protein [Deltaproteobacteria bacterium]|nr:DUF547 domain-containing protein [Deltaproteobacteria bacterium]